MDDVDDDVEEEGTVLLTDGRRPLLEGVRVDAL